MRTILLIVAVLIGQLGLKAQGVQTATLHHGEEFKTFYSANAFRQALAEAQAGDVINLSAGAFKGGTIETPVSIKGIGIGNLGEESSSANGLRTVITDAINIDVTENEEGKTMSMEGMECNRLNIRNAANSIFSKMMITIVSGSQTESDSKMENLTFVHCVINDFYPASDATCQLFNCVLPGFNSLAITSESSFTLNNCIVYSKYNQTIAKSSVALNNCIIDCSEKEDFRDNTMTNCVVKGPSNYSYYADRNTDKDRNNRVFEDGMQVFKEGTYYQLTDEAAKYLGSDGTQVGIYGSNLPFSVKTSYPQIKKFTVAPESTSDGKLKIEIEIDANNE